ncbi:immunity repressor [Gordonia phage Leroy]|nr:immunity repressor [Gordonia phage Leroy]
MVGPVSESNLPPETWRPLFDKAGIEFGYRPLAARAGMTHTRVHRLIRGGGTTDAAIEQVAEALGVRASKIRELRGESAEVREPFTLPDDAGRLNHDERNVIRSMVRALLDARDRNATQPTDTPAEEQGTPGTANTDEKTQPGGNVTTLTPRNQGPKPEQPEDAKAARKRNPRFKPQDPDESH